MTSNLLVVMSDEHQARALGCAGHTFVRTPCLDALAGRGIRFANACTPSPICVPARASFATGMHVHQTRLWDNAMPYAGQIEGWGHALQARGVRVESIGKLHYRAKGDPSGFDAEHNPMMVADGVGMVWASIRSLDERLRSAERMLGDHIGPGYSRYNEYDDDVVSRTCEWLSDRSGDSDPWCLFVGLVAPHFPLVVPREWFDLYPAELVRNVKLHPSDGYRRHPWVEIQNEFMDTEGKFSSLDERLAARSAYFGLCSYLDHNVGRILDALESAGLADSTTVVYTSDHGDNAGARGLWGKSNMYEESVSVPLIIAGGGIRQGLCSTPVSLIDLSATIVDHFRGSWHGTRPGESLYSIASARDDPNRAVFSEYHAAGSVSGAFMIRTGRWKYIHYVGFEPELFDLESDPEETVNLAGDPGHSAILAYLDGKLQEVCDPDKVDRQAHEDQASLIESHGGRDAAMKLGAPGATPVPSG